MKSQKRSQVRRQHRCQEPKGTLSTFIILDGRGKNYPIHMNRQKCNRILDNFSLKVLKVQAWGNLYSIWKGVKKESWKLKKTRPSKLWESSLGKIHIKKIFTLKNIYPKNIHPWKIFIPENIHSWKKFTTEKYSPLKNIHT